MADEIKVPKAGADCKGLRAVNIERQIYGEVDALFGISAKVAVTVNTLRNHVW